jgi:DNA-binding CsgD family transcriptional regulator
LVSDPAREDDPTTPNPGRGTILVALLIDAEDLDLQFRDILAGQSDITVVNSDGDPDVIFADRPVSIPGASLILVHDRRSGQATLQTSEVKAVVDRAVDSGTVSAIVRLVAAGYSVMPVRSVRDSGANDNPLTERERQVLELLAGGSSNKAIARALGVMPSTAKFHVASILDKLGAESRIDAIAIAIRRGLIFL